ncbi:uncharacterized protein LOC100026344 [Monodelphis domestica]|uniref:uncharacterized protein LOC100026344 n=1 Tax=Monodelphis domestica TaxID=13616 RepID=UPI0024E1F5D9|nr:uncharacterized protein LOC100026344 [Monodelphis domestica]
MTSSEQAEAATVTAIIEVASIPETDHETYSHRFLTEGPRMPLLDPGDPETLERPFTLDQVLGPEHAQETEQKFLESIRAVLGSVSRGYSVSVLIRGREAKQPDLVPQLLAMLFEEIQPIVAFGPSLRTLSLVQLSSSGKGQDLLSGAGDLSLLDVCPLGLVVEGASEAEVLDSKSGCQLYLKAMEGLDRAYSLLTVTFSCLEPSTIKRPWVRSLCRGSLRVLQLPEAPNCPLLLALAGKTSKAHVGSLLWIVTQLLFGNSYSSLLLYLDPRVTPLELLLASLSGAKRAQDPTQSKQVSPILWDASEEIQARRAALQVLRSGLSGTTLQESQLTQMSLVLRELKVLKNQSRYYETMMLKGPGASAPGLPNIQVLDSKETFSPVFQKHPQGEFRPCDPHTIFLEFLLVYLSSPRIKIFLFGSMHFRNSGPGKEVTPISSTRKLPSWGLQEKGKASPIPIESTWGTDVLFCGETSYCYGSLAIFITEGNAGFQITPPDIALQFMLARAHRQLLREHHRSQIQEKLSCLKQDKETATDQIPGQSAENLSWGQDHTALALQVEALRLERDAAEQDLEALYKLYVQGTRTQTCHILQVFQACQGLWKEQAAAREFHHRVLLAGVLQDAVSLATQNEQLQVQNEQLKQGEDYEKECRKEVGFK